MYDMRIPEQFIGNWGGIVTDTRLMNPYRGEVVLKADGISTRYDMARGPKLGELAPLCDSDGFLVFKERVGSFYGTLVLYLDRDDALKCVWRDKSGFSSEATMTRASTPDTNPD